MKGNTLGTLIVQWLTGEIYKYKQEEIQTNVW